MKIYNKDVSLVIIFIVLTCILWMIPTGYEERRQPNSIRCRGEIVNVENSEIQRMGMIKKGHQDVEIKILDGKFKGRLLDASNQLLGRLDLDKIYQPGDTAFVVLTLNEKDEIIFVNPQDHYRLGLESFLLILFALLLVAYGGVTGLKALLSFCFTGMMIWKIIVPMFLKGAIDPILLSLITVAGLCGAIIFLVAGVSRKALTAFAGSCLGVLTSCGLALYFTEEFHIHGAVLPFSETLLYSGFGHLDLGRIYVSAVFIAASGAVMDLAMDVAASMDEVAAKKPSISSMELMKSGFSVGRVVVGTMTTTLLLAYSGGYITLLMAFMAQGVPVANMFNLIYVAAEILKTLVGSFGLVTVAPFTAVVGAYVLKRPA